MKNNTRFWCGNWKQNSVSIYQASAFGGRLGVAARNARGKSRSQVLTKDLAGRILGNGIREENSVDPLVEHDLQRCAECKVGVFLRSRFIIHQPVQAHKEVPFQISFKKNAFVKINAWVCLSFSRKIDITARSYFLCHELFDLILTDVRAFNPYNECNRDFTSKFIFHPANGPGRI
jgi:hypothetical protein